MKLIDLKKLAQEHKIKGRSKMNKAELIAALATVSSSLIVERVTYTEVTGNLLDYVAPYYIAHQCNTQSKRTAGLSAHIFNKYPEANDYARSTQGTVGTIHVIDHVINMFAQLKPGKPAGSLDNVAKRIEYFSSCLQAIATQLPKDSTVVFPYGVGCGMAGGDWPTYEALLKEFSKTINVIVVKLP
jgi:hypothetical protein